MLFDRKRKFFRLIFQVEINSKKQQTEEKKGRGVAVQVLHTKEEKGAGHCPPEGEARHGRARDLGNANVL